MEYIKNRVVYCEDAIKWLENNQNKQYKGSIFCGIPDMYDVYDLNSSSSNSSINNTSQIITTTLTNINGLETKAKEYKKWFISTINLIFNLLEEGQCVIFTQTDGKILSNEGNVIYWMDKSYLCISEAEKYNCTLLWHKIAIDNEAEVSSHRPCYTHLLCFGKSFTFHTSKFLTPDVIDRGLMTWEKATGLEACLLCIAFLRYVVNTSCVLNPFCGKGTILAVANYFGLQSIGIEVMPKRARKALSRDLRSQINSLPIEKLRILLGNDIIQQLFPHLVTNNNKKKNGDSNNENNGDGRKSNDNEENSKENNENKELKEVEKVIEENNNDNSEDIHLIFSTSDHNNDNNDKNSDTLNLNEINNQSS